MNGDRFVPGTTQGPVSVGSIITIAFTNASLAGTMITVDLSDGATNSVSVQILLNAEGYGTTTWTVPAWDLVRLSHATSSDHTIAVQ